MVVGDDGAIYEYRGPDSKPIRLAKPGDVPAGVYQYMVQTLRQYKDGNQ
jgi:hypothetical protein